MTQRLTDITTNKISMITRQTKHFYARAAVMLLMLLVTTATALAIETKQLPYSYGFENNDLTVEGWERVDCANDSKIQTLLPNSGSYSFNLSSKRFTAISDFS